MELAQQRYKSYCGRNHHDVEYEVGQWVWLRLLHHPVASLPGQSRGKLRPHFFDPFKILARVGAVAYQLQLPAGVHLHDVFHVGLLKKYCGEEPAGPGALPPIQHGRGCLEPEEVTKSRLARERTEVLVHWAGQPAGVLPRLKLQSLSSSIQRSSSRTNLLSRGGEMLCAASSTTTSQRHVPIRPPKQRAIRS
jgi:hypothetical protein